MDIYKRLEDDMKASLKDGNALKLSVIRMVISAVKMLEIENNVKPPAEGDILQIIQKQIKQHKDSVDQFENGKRPDLAEKERLELAILESYMPKQLSEDEISAMVKAAMDETGALTKSDMGKVMKALSEKVKGRADGRTVSQIVMRMLK